MMHFLRKEEQGISAIFVHAGAGFHSYQSENVHMWVCDQAARLGMALLKTGGSAVDAVEVAIKFFEDHEVTNSGYGSNLTVSGTVECDATIVDHLGRSGAVGSLEHIKNPIALARMVLDASIKPMSLNRVPPNLLVGSGATDFAYENGMPVLPGDVLMSHGARERWLRWKRELDQVEGKNNGHDEFMDFEGQGNAQDSSTDGFPSPSIRGVSPAGSLATDIGNILPRLHRRSVSHHDFGFEDAGMEFERSHAPSSANDITPQSGLQGSIGAREDEDTTQTGYTDEVYQRILPPSALDIAAEGSNSQPTCHSTSPRLPVESLSRGKESNGDKTYDNINDTVGAIAIDCHGNIAAASSSGGIGMKHCGRTGPAALIGIGTAVIPVDPEDEMKTCAAAVASGTGEHMTTTMAASTCAERIYSSIRKVSGEPGAFESVTEDEAMAAVVEKDFMGHPAVDGSHCHAAIGLMAVKKTKDGIGFFFGHNTESFAVASASSVDEVPWCLMSRSKGDGKTAQGGRYTRFSRHRASTR